MIIKKIIGFLLQGIFYTVPIGITVYIIFKAVVFVDNLLQFDIPGVGLIVILCFLIFIGYIGSTLISQQITHIEKWIKKIPLIKIVYSSVKDFLDALIGKKKKFTRPVRVKMEGNVQRLGFITREKIEELDAPDNFIAVYIPYSFAITGNLILVPKEDIFPINTSPTKTMKFIFSGGVTSLEDDEN